MNDTQTINNATFLSDESSLSSRDLFFLQDVIDEIHRTTPLLKFKSLFAQISKDSQNNQSAPDPVLQGAIQQAFRQTISCVNTLLYHTRRFTPQQRELVGQWMHQEFIGFCLLGSWPSRGLNKPQNIAGDHHIIKQIYRNADQEATQLGQIVNYCFLKEPACEAVKNRKEYMKDYILEKITSNKDTTTYIASIASGPAEEIFNVYEILGKEDRKRLKAVAIDRDKRACASVDDRIHELGLSQHFSTHALNILKPDHAFKDQDLVYSMGLIDYFKDRATVKIINTLHAMLKPGGEAIVGNFHESCDSRLFLDYLLDWPLVYRSEEDMHRLFSQSHFQGHNFVVDFEAESTNMLARCTKT